MKAKGLDFTEKQPPRNAVELAERTAQEAAKQMNKGLDKTKASMKELDQKYKIADKTNEVTQKTKEAILGLFKKSTPSQ